MKKNFTHFKIILLLAIFTCTSVGINNTYAFVLKPKITVTPGALTFSYVEGKGPSSPQEVTITYKNCESLEIKILKENSNYEYSTDGQTFTSFPTEPVSVPDVHGSFVLFVRLKGGLATGTYDEIHGDGEGAILEGIKIVGHIGKRSSEEKFVSLEGEVTPDNTTSINEDTDNAFHIRATCGHLFVETAVDGAPIEVYNTLGQKIASQLAIKGRNDVALTEKGLLIVRVGKRTQKIIVR